ncbi:MAG TPA: hypothetical protein VJ798_13015 [Rhizomicrobium sp.]|nr:hypothetical protein [Rhizomicrobium sp.]
MTMTRIPTALELSAGELILLRNIVADGFMPGRQAMQRDIARLVALQLIQSAMGGLIATPAGHIVARL